MGHDDDYDIIIVGGAAVGASLAIALSHQFNHSHCKIKILVLESKKKSAVSSTRTLALNAGAREFYTQMGVWPRLSVHVTPIQKVMASMAGHYGQTRFTASDYGVEALGYVINLSVLENHLREYIIENIAQVHWQQPVKLNQAMLIEKGWKVEVQGEDDSPRIVTTRLLIAADGLHSLLRQQQGIGLEITDYGHRAVIFNMTVEKSHHHIAYERFLSTGALALLPYGEKGMTVIWTLSEGDAIQTAGLDEPELLKTLYNIFGNKLGRFISASTPMVFPLKMYCATMQIARRMVLVGNAAHQLHPIAAQGLNLSLRDINVLAKCLKEGYLADQDIGRLAVLQKYNQFRTADQHRVILATDKIAKLYSGDTLPGWVKAMSMLMFDSCLPLKKIAARLAMGIGG